MKKLGIVLIIIGISIVGWFGYKHWLNLQSMKELHGNVVKHEDNDTSSLHFLDNQSEPIDHSNGEEVAILVMPSIGISYDVFWGTGDNVLAKGVGMYESDVTTTPDQKGHTVLSGHRDSVFRPVGELQDGDSIYVQYQGQDYEYKINKTWITDAQDQNVIINKDEPTLTLTTCYPFEFIGDAPDRYIIQAEYVQEGHLLDL